MGQRRVGKTDMADSRGLKIIGWTLGSITAAVMFIGAMVVHDAVAGSSLHLERAAISSVE